jgi:hypothetical protein
MVEMAEELDVLVEDTVATKEDSVDHKVDLEANKVDSVDQAVLAVNKEDLVADPAATVDLADLVDLDDQVDWAMVDLADMVADMVAGANNLQDQYDCKMFFTRVLLIYVICLSRVCDAE